MAKTKKEIDKEIMYNKIMPSGLKGGRGQDDPAVGQPAQAEARPASGQQAAPVMPVTPAAAAPDPKTTLFGGDSGVRFKEKSPSLLVNLMENIVVEKMDAAFEKFNCCKCDKCKKDVAAIALNKLKPKYIVLDADKVVPPVPPQVSAEVTTAIVQAIIQVRSHPRH